MRVVDEAEEAGVLVLVVMVGILGLFVTTRFDVACFACGEGPTFCLSFLGERVVDDGKVVGRPVEVGTVLKSGLAEGGGQARGRFEDVPATPGRIFRQAL